MSEKKKDFDPIKVNVVSGVVIEKDEKYLLFQEKQKHNDGLWNFPAGLLEKGLTLEENAIRKAKEKTGYDVKIISKIGAFQDDARSSAKNAYEAEIIGEELKIQEDKIFNAKWFSYEEILKMKDKLEDSWVLEAIELLRFRKKSEDYLNNWKRCQADFENYKKNQVKVMEEFKQFAKLDLVIQILPVLDNFNASLKHVPEDQKSNAWVTGINFIKKQLEDILKNNGVEEIKTEVGDKFDPGIHEAVKQDADSTNKKDVNNADVQIKTVIQKGYKFNGRVIRAVKVVVS